MPGFFEALENLQKRKKSHFVEIGGRQVEVSLDKKLEIIRKGVENFILKDGKIPPKPRRLGTRRFPVLENKEKGYVFYDNDPYWVKEITEEGYTWQTRSE
jgi:hypothetical protein